METEEKAKQTTNQEAIPEPERKVVDKKKISREIISWILTVALAIAAAFLVNQYVLINSTVVSGSMENTVMTNDRIIGFRLAYLFSEPQRGDIIVFKEAYTDRLILKRIIGLPGETITILGGKVYVDGEVLEEDYIKDVTRGNFGPYLVPEGEYFVLGDNRNNSSDSRYWSYPYITKDQILGKVFVRYYPLDQIVFY